MFAPPCCEQLFHCRAFNYHHWSALGRSRLVRQTSFGKSHDSNEQLLSRIEYDESLVEISEHSSEFVGQEDGLVIDQFEQLAVGRKEYPAGRRICFD